MAQQRISPETRRRLDVIFNHHAPAGDKAKRHEAVRAVCKHAAINVLQLTPSGPEQAEAIKKFQEAMFWANAAIAREGLAS